MKKIIDKADERIKRLEFNLSDIQSSKAIGIYITTVCEEFIKELTNTDVLKEQRTHIKDYLTETVMRNYYSYLIYLSNEFPEFALSMDLDFKKFVITQQDQMLSQLKTSSLNKVYLENIKEDLSNLKIIIKENTNELKDICDSLEKIRNYKFDSSTGFENIFDEESFLERALDDFASIYKQDKLTNIEAHHNEIKSYLRERLVHNGDITEIIYPRNEEIFIPQSF